MSFLVVIDGHLFYKCSMRNAAQKEYHGGRHTRLYKRWHEMKSRCINPGHPRYKDYGGRGITVCPEWLRFGAFNDWARANGYRRELQLDRVNNDSGYSPENCRWTTPAKNMRNQRRNRYHVFRGERMTITDAALKYGLHFSTISNRLERGDTPDEAVRPPRAPK